MTCQQKVVYENLTYGKPSPPGSVGYRLTPGLLLADTTMKRMQVRSPSDSWTGGLWVNSSFGSTNFTFAIGLAVFLGNPFRDNVAQGHGRENEEA